ncbi:MAG: hypothetical protein Q9N34_00660 [Aquificota bacterium]|nr:hypothetical protein [Aquificota bacterium]
MNIKREETKRCVMDAMIDAYRKVIALSDVEYLSYVTDDLDIAYAQLHSSEFISNRYHVYIDMDRRVEEVSTFIGQHAVELQPRLACSSMADFIKVARAKTLQEARESVRAAEQRGEQMAAGSRQSSRQSR